MLELSAGGEFLECLCMQFDSLASSACTFMDSNMLGRHKMHMPS